jgi:hypothetical protein
MGLVDQSERDPGKQGGGGENYCLIVLLWTHNTLFLGGVMIPDSQILQFTNKGLLVLKRSKVENQVLVGR